MDVARAVDRARPADRARTEGSSHVDVLLVVATGAAIVPIVVAAVMAIANQWTALGDNAQLLLRSRDVFTEHTPLVGARSSSDSVVDFEYNAPGPLLYYIFAVPVRLWEDAGLVVAVAATAIGSIVGIACVLRRAAGPVVAIVGLVAVTGLGWTMGRPLLVDTWQPHSLLHPLLLFLVLAWATAAGDQRLLPWTAAVATLLFQSHLTYAYLVPAVSAVAVAGLAVGADRVRRRARDRWPDRWSGLRRAGLATAVVLAVLWLPPLVEQITAPGRGNLARLLVAARPGSPTVGAEVGLRRSASVLAAPPTWLRPSLEGLGVAPRPSSAALGLGVLAAILGCAAWWAWRRRDRFGFAGVVVALVAAIAAVYSTTATIRTVFGLGYHHVLYLWPIAIIVQLVVAVVVIRSLGPAASRRIAIGATLLVVLLAGANLPDVDRSSGPPAAVDLHPVVRDLRSQLDALADRGTLLVAGDTDSFAEPYTHALVADLGRRGVEFVMTSPIDVRRFGEGRAYEGEADAVVMVRSGAAAMRDEPDAERVAFASLLADDELASWHRLRAAVVAAVEVDGVELTPDGRRAIAIGFLDLPVDGDTVRIDDPGSFVERRTFAAAIDLDWIRVPGAPTSTLHDWTERNLELVESTVSIWIRDRAT